MCILYGNLETIIGPYEIIEQNLKTKLILKRVVSGRRSFARLRVTSVLHLTILLMVNPNTFSNSNPNPTSVFNLEFQFRFLVKCQSEASDIIFPVYQSIRHPENPLLPMYTCYKTMFQRTLGKSSQVNLLHFIGVGDPIPNSDVRMMLAMRINSIVRGYR